MHIVALADRITKESETLIERRNSFYQAHLLKAELDQLLRALSEIIKDANLAVDKPRCKLLNIRKNCLKPLS
jgi:hypothetical protein